MRTIELVAAIFLIIGLFLFIGGFYKEDNLDWISKDLCADCNSKMNVYLKTNINNKVELNNRSLLKKWLDKIFK